MHHHLKATIFIFVTYEEINKGIIYCCLILVAIHERMPEDNFGDRLRL